MAYPPPWYDDDRDRPEVYREVVQPGEDPRPIIHFDMHPLNGIPPINNVSVFMLTVRSIHR